MSAHRQGASNQFSPRAFLVSLKPESRAVIVFFVLAFLGNGLPRIFTSTVATTLFLDVFGARMLPWTYMGSAIAIPVVGYLFLRLEARLPFGRLLLLTMLADLLVLLGLWLGLANGTPPWLVMASMIWVEVEWVLVGLVFWGMAERVFDIRQAKRLFGVIGAGEAVAVVLGGFLMPVLVDLFAVVDLLWLSIVGVGSGCVIVHAATRHYREDIDVDDDEDEDEESTAGAAPGVTAGARRGLLDVLGNPYIALLFGLSAISMFTYFCIDNAFFELVETRYVGEAELASFLGLFGAWTGALRLLLASFVFAWLMKHHGLAAGLRSLPALLLLGTGVLLVAGIGLGSAALVFPVACFIKLNDEALRDGVDATAFRLLYQPLRPQQRIRAEAVEESFLEPLAGGAAGLLLLLLINQLDFRAIELFACIAVLLAIWLLLVAPVHRAYLRRLAQAIGKRTFGAGSVNIDDDGSRAIVMAGLDDENASKVIYSLYLLRQAGFHPMAPILARLLSHPAAEVRREVLASIEALRLRELAQAVRQRLDLEAVAELRGAALVALAAMHDVSGAEPQRPSGGERQGAPGQQAMLDLLIAHLHDEKIETRSGALVGLMLHGGIEGIVVAGESFLSMADAEDPRLRMAAAGVLERLANQQFARSLVPLLGDEDVAVRRRALHAAASMAAPQLYPLLGRMLAVPAVRGSAAMALVAGGEFAVPFVAELLHSPDTATDVRTQALDVLGRIGGAAATDALLGSLGELPEPLRYQRLLALERCGFNASGKHAEDVLRCMREDIAAARTIIDWLAVMTGYGATELACDAFRHELLKYRHRIFLGLASLHDQHSVRQAWQQYAEGSQERRAYALEIVDNLLPRALRAPALAVLENNAVACHGAQDDASRAALARRVLANIARGDVTWAGEWLRAASLFCLGRLAAQQGDPDGDAETTLLATIAHGPRLLRESALRGLIELRPVRLREHLQHLARDSASDLAAVARTLLESEGGTSTCC